VKDKVGQNQNYFHLDISSFRWFSYPSVVRICINAVSHVTLFKSKRQSLMLVVFVAGAG
jgi:hypothetical protein